MGPSPGSCTVEHSARSSQGARDGVRSRRSSRQANDSIGRDLFETGVAIRPTASTSGGSSPRAVTARERPHGDTRVVCESGFSRSAPASGTETGLTLSRKVRIILTCRLVPAGRCPQAELGGMSSRCAALESLASLADSCGDRNRLRRGLACLSECLHEDQRIDSSEAEAARVAARPGMEWLPRFAWRRVHSESSGRKRGRQDDTERIQSQQSSARVCGPRANQRV